MQLKLFTSSEIKIFTQNNLQQKSAGSLSKREQGEDASLRARREAHQGGECALAAETAARGGASWGAVQTFVREWVLSGNGGREAVQWSFECKLHNVDILLSNIVCIPMRKKRNKYSWCEETEIINSIYIFTTRWSVMHLESLYFFG